MFVRPHVPITFLVVLLSAFTPCRAMGMDWCLSAGAGASIPIGSGALQDGVDIGGSATSAVALDLDRGFEILGRFAYSWFPRDDAGALRKAEILHQPMRVVQLSGGELTVVEGSLDLRFYPSQGGPGGSTHPYVLTSAGIASLDLEPVDILYAYAGHTWPADVAGSSGTYLALGFGGGLRFNLTRRFGLLCEARYQIIFQEEESFRSIPLRLEFVFGL